jgi:hypothetical protein
MPILVSNQQRAQSCWALACSYNEAFRRLYDSENSAQTYLPSIFLLLHSLELFLKSYLIARGYSEKQLRAIGHDLIMALRLGFQNELSTFVRFSWIELLNLARINRYYNKKELEYFFSKNKNFGQTDQFAEIVERISRGVYGSITVG